MSGAPNIISFPSRFNSSIKGFKAWGADTVSMMPSIVPSAAYVTPIIKDLAYPHQILIGKV